MVTIVSSNYKTFPIEQDEHLLAVLRYVERNALRANLVKRVEAWKYGSLWRYLNGDEDSVLSPWPVKRPRTWRAMINRPQNEKELRAIRRCVKKGCPYGTDHYLSVIRGPDHEKQHKSIKNLISRQKRRGCRH